MCQFKLLTTTRVLQIILMSRLQCCIEGDRVNFIHALKILNSIPRSNKSIIRMHECHQHCVPHREPSQTGVASLVFLQRRRSQCHPRVAYFMDHSEKLIYIALAFEKMLVSVALQKYTMMLVWQEQCIKLADIAFRSRSKSCYCFIF